MTVSNDFESISNARMLTFDLRCKSDQSRQLAGYLIFQINNYETRKRKRQKVAQASFEMCVEAVLGCLIKAAANEASHWVYRSLHRQSFSEAVFGADTFIAVIRSLESLGFVMSRKGGNVRNPFAEGSEGAKAYNPGLATRFVATDKLMALCYAHEIEPNDLYDHFYVTKPESLIVLRPSSRRAGRAKIKQRSMKFEANEHTKMLEKRVSELNDYLFEQRLEGGIFTGYQRIFNEGDHPQFNWDRGGRLYCVGEGHYQLLKKAERLKMKINGEPVAEIDINASYLTIVLPQLGGELPARGDIYAVDGLPREVVKAWITATLGFEGFHERWPVGQNAELKKRGIDTSRGLSMKAVEERVLDAYPELANWPTSSLNWSQLMFMESEAVQTSISHLRKVYDAPAYSVHDSIIVRQCDADKAVDSLKQSYKARLHVDCRVEISKAQEG